MLRRVLNYRLYEKTYIVERFVPDINFTEDVLQKCLY